MINDNIYDKCKLIKCLILDVDGTMTDGTVFYSSDGEAIKRFSIRDGMGIELLKKAGLKIAIITSENSNIVKARASKLKIEHLVLGSRNKKKDLLSLLEKLNLNLEQIAYMGDDVNDLQAIELVGLSGCPADSVKTIKYKCDYICQNEAGKGAVREFIELILLSQNKSITLPEDW